jgi:hypothetical protein
MEQSTHNHKTMWTIIVLSALLALSALILSILSWINVSTEEETPSENVEVVLIDNDILEEETLSEEIDSPVLAIDPDQDEVNSEETDKSIYKNESLGITFPIPNGYTISETTSEGYQGGKINYITLYDEEGAIVANLQATTPEYIPEYSEGCCWYFLEDIDTSDDLSTLESIIEETLGNVFNPYKSNIDGKTVISFNYAASYAETYLFQAEIVNLHNSNYTQLFITSGSLWTEVGSLSDNIDEIEQALLKETSDPSHDLRDFERLDKYQQFLGSITWLY